jgi:hypothetical protein
MKTLQTLIVLFAASLLAGCGKKADSPAAPAAKGAVATATAAAPARPAVHCPPPASAAPAGPDVIGVRLGMARDEAMNAVLCASPTAFVSPRDRWVERIDTHGQKLGTQVFTARSGVTEPCNFKKMNITEMERCGEGGLVWKHVSEVVTVASPGVPGEEKVLGLWRTQRFAEGEMPTVAAAIDALQAKYGAGAVRSNPTQPSGYVALDWLQDPAGLPMPPGHPLYRQCANNLQPRADGAQRWSEGCGLTVVAAVIRSATNAELAAEVDVGLADQGRLMATTDGLQAALDKLDRARRQSETRNAADTKVKL